jgi:hypothetical protein
MQWAVLINKGDILFSRMDAWRGPDEMPKLMLGIWIQVSLKLKEGKWIPDSKQNKPQDNHRHPQYITWKSTNKLKLACGLLGPHARNSLVIWHFIKSAIFPVSLTNNEASKPFFLIVIPAVQRLPSWRKEFHAMAMKQTDSMGMQKISWWTYSLNDNRHKLVFLQIFASSSIQFQSQALKYLCCSKVLSIMISPVKGPLTVVRAAPSRPRFDSSWERIKRD